MKLYAFIVFTLIGSLPVQAGAEMYQWTNPDGSVGITDDLGQVPQNRRDQATQKKGAQSEERVYFSDQSGKNAAAREPASPGPSDQPETKPEKQIPEEKKKSDVM